MADERTRSLLLIDADADERRLVSAIAARAGWSVVGAADDENAKSDLQGTPGREGQAAQVGAWHADPGPK
jgi:hypothetical protein